MNKEEFTNALKEILEERTGCEVNVQHVTKNNGIKLTGLTIRREGTNTYPTIYTERFFEEYCDDMGLREIADHVLELERKHSLEQPFDVSALSCFETAKQGIVYKIINTEKNRELLETVPHKEFLDLSKVYMAVVNNTRMGRATMLVTNKQMEYWGVTLEEIDQNATARTEELLPYSIRSMEDIVGQIAGEEEMPSYTFPITGMFVATNKESCLGAGVFLYKDMLKDFAGQMGDDLFILPSSTHETIILTYSEAKNTDIGFLRNMVREVNETQVEPEEFLSNNVYVYKRETGKIEIA